MLFTLRQLEHLLAIADSGRISAAARTLHITQPALSASLQQLESACGTPLFVRHHARGVSLTPSGRKLVVEARHLLMQAVEFENYARHLGDAIDGELEVGCFTTLAPLWIPQMLGALRERFPRLSVHIRESDLRDLHSAVLDGQLELSLSYDIDVPERLRVTPLKRMRTYALLPASHPLAERRDLSLCELRDEPLVLLDLPHSREYFRSVFAEVGMEPEIAHRTTSFEMVRCMVANGHGYTVLNQRLETSTSYDGKALVMVPLSDRLPPLQVVFLTLRGARLTRRARALMDFASAYYRQKM